MRPRTILFTLLSALLLPALCGCSKAPTAPKQVAITSPVDAAVSAGITPAKVRTWIALHAARHREMALRARSFGAEGSTEPVPIPGGFGPGFHVWVPGPPEFGFQGLNIEPGTVSDFNGFAAMGYFGGTLVGSDGATYEVFHDMRIQKGTYVAADGSVRRGTFAFI